MIADIDEALRALIAGAAGDGVDVTFVPPSQEWSIHLDKPKVDIFLYDICEDPAIRGSALENVRDETGRTTARKVPPKWYRLSYLLTAWGQTAEDEHKLLSAVLEAVAGTPILRFDVPAGSPADQPYPVPVTIAVPSGAACRPTDLWTALGCILKPSLNLVVTAPVSPGPAVDTAPPVLQPTKARVVDKLGGDRATVPQ